MKVPGETDIRIESLTIQGPGGQDLSIDYADLIPRLGLRVKTLIMTDRYYSDFRVAEDQRRLTAFWETHGYFDVVVDHAAVVIDEKAKTANLTWTIHEGERYAIGDVVLKNARPEHEAELRDIITFKEGDTEPNLETYRKLRHDMGDWLRREGYGHAMIYSRSYVDKKKKVVHWYYFVDTGPKTYVRSIVVDGNHKIPADMIIERTGIEPGDEFNLDMKDKAELDLLDTGAFTSAFIRSGTDVKFIVPGTAPDTGGVLRDEQVDADGNLVPRELSPGLDLIVHVVEAPSVQVRVRGGFEVDPNRVDTSLGSRFWFRNLFGPQHHLTLEGRIGFGAIYRGADDDPSGLYGEALARTEHPGTFGRLGDLRLTARFRDELFPGFHLREVTGGPGIRTAITSHLFFDTDVFFRYGKQIDFGPFDAAERAEFALPEDDESLGGELASSIIWDERDNPVETLRGHLLALRGVFAPGEALNTHRYLVVSPDARGFLPLTDSISLAARGQAGWVFLDGDDGVPLGPRLFGGGAFGMRGYGRHQLSPRVFDCVVVPGGPTPSPYCKNEVVGGLSLVEASLEARLLPYLKPYGVVVFADFGGAGAELNPFESGLSAAVGLGLRLRIWYLPIALDGAYRVVTEGETDPPDHLDPILLFFRVGEAF